MYARCHVYQLLIFQFPQFLHGPPCCEAVCDHWAMLCMHIYNNIIIYRHLDITGSPIVPFSACMCVCVCLSVFISVCVYVFMSSCLPVFISVCVYVWMSVCLHISLFVCLSVCLHICLCVCMSVCFSLFVCVFVYQYVCLWLAISAWLLPLHTAHHIVTHSTHTVGSGLVTLQTQCKVVFVLVEIHRLGFGHFQSFMLQFLPLYKSNKTGSSESNSSLS